MAEKKNILIRALTWWNGQTLGTRLFTARHGTHVGTDAAGNRFYRNRDGSRRWVIYNGEAEASAVCADWHGWLHHTLEECPADSPLPRKSWEADHTPNMTGTAAAYRPEGSLLTQAITPAVS